MAVEVVLHDHRSIWTPMINKTVISRLKKRFTQQQIAERAGYQFFFVAQIEKGKPGII
jgi:hypothetical protein